MKEWPALSDSKRYRFWPSTSRMTREGLAVTPLISRTWSSDLHGTRNQKSFQWRALAWGTAPEGCIATKKMMRGTFVNVELQSKRHRVKVTWNSIQIPFCRPKYATCPSTRPSGSCTCSVFARLRKKNRLVQHFAESKFEDFTSLATSMRFWNSWCCLGRFGCCQFSGWKNEALWMPVGWQALKEEANTGNLKVQFLFKHVCFSNEHIYYHRYHLALPKRKINSKIGCKAELISSMGRAKSNLTVNNGIFQVGFWKSSEKKNLNQPFTVDLWVFGHWSLIHVQSPLHHLHDDASG